MAFGGAGESRLANQCLSIAAGISAPEKLAELHLLGTLTAVYHDVSREHRVYDDFAAAADADLAELEGYRLEAMAPVPVEFFARRLFAPHTSVPAGWQPVLAEWAALLGVVELSGVYEFYLKLCAGTTLSLEGVSAIVEAWARNEGDVVASRATEAPAPQEPVSQSGVEPDIPPVAAAVAETPSEASVPGTPPAQTAADATDSKAAATAAAGRPPLFMLADGPLEDRFDERDLLDFKDYAESLAVILDSVVDTPFTMSINAPWGAGKTSLANMLAARLRELPRDRGDAPHVLFTFNAWMHDDAPNLATALISEVSRQADRHRPWFLRIAQPLPAALLEPSIRRWRRAAYVLAVVGLTVLGFWWVGEHLQHDKDQKTYAASLKETYQETSTRSPDGAETSRAETATRRRDVTPPEGVPPPVHPEDRVLNWFQERMALLGGFLTAVAGLVTVLVRLLSSTSLMSFVQSPEKAAETGAIFAARTKLKSLIGQATARGNRFIVFVDDIERCKPPRAVDVLDAVNQLLDHRNVIVVLLGDMASVAAAAQLKYKDLAAIYVPSADYVVAGVDRQKELFGRLYIQKIVQYQFDLPALPKHKIQEFVARLLGITDSKGDRDGGPD